MQGSGNVMIQESNESKQRLKLNESIIEPLGSQHHLLSS